MNIAKLLKHWRMDAAGMVIVAGLFLTAYLGQISPLLHEHEQARAQAIELATEQAKSLEMERSLHSLKDQIEAKARDAASAQLKLEPISEVNHRLTRLTELAGDNSLQIDSVESGATSHLERYSTVAIRLGGRGTYRNCLTLIRRLRSAMPDMGIIGLDLVSGGVNPDTTATFHFDMVWYAQPAAKSAKR